MLLLHSLLLLWLIRGFKSSKPSIQDYNLTFQRASNSQTYTVHNIHESKSFSQANNHSIIPSGLDMPWPQAQVISCSFGFSVALCEVFLEFKLEDSQGVKGTPFL